MASDVVLQLARGLLVGVEHAALLDLEPVHHLDATHNTTHASVLVAWRVSAESGAGGDVR
jgi:hypothetical protein